MISPLIANKSRLQYLDWLRGLAVVLMIQVHASDSFLKVNLRGTEWYRLSQFLGGLAAPLFLFTVGLSIALVSDRMVSKNAERTQLLERAIRRGAWILLLAYAFRIEQTVTWYPYGNWADILKIDILNCIAVSSLVAGIAAAFSRNRKTNAALLAGAAALIIFTTPAIAPLRTRLPAIVMTYINGNGRLDYFTFFPWAAYTFVGAAVGYLLLEARRAEREYPFMLWLAALGTVLFVIGYEVNGHPGLMPGLASYTRSSPHYIFQKLGYMFILLYGSYRWQGRSTESRWSPLLLFGQTSLLVYWLHIEFVYGRLRLFRNSLGLAATGAQLLWLIPLMLWIATMRVRWKANRKTEPLVKVQT